MTASARPRSRASAKASRWPQRRWGRPFLYFFAALVGLGLIGPMLIVIPMSFSDSARLQFPPSGFSLRWYQDFFGSQMWTAAAVDSIRIATFAVVISTALGTVMALGLVRGRFPGKPLVNGLVFSPMIVPLVVTAIGMFFTFSRWRLQGTVLGLVAAHTALAIPFVVVTVSTSLRTLDPNLEMAARSLGASPVKTFFRITVPLILPGIIAGALFAFVTSWDEVIVAIFLTSPLVRTLPMVMWTEIRYEMTPTIASVATMLIALTVLTLALVLLAQRAASSRASRRSG